MVPQLRGPWRGSPLRLHGVWPEAGPGHPPCGLNKGLRGTSLCPLAPSCDWGGGGGGAARGWQVLHEVPQLYLWGRSRGDRLDQAALAEGSAVAWGWGHGAAGHRELGPRGGAEPAPVRKTGLQAAPSGGHVLPAPCEAGPPSGGGGCYSRPPSRAPARDGQAGAPRGACALVTMPRASVRWGLNLTLSGPSPEPPKPSGQSLRAWVGGSLGHGP